MSEFTKKYLIEDYKLIIPRKRKVRLNAQLLQRWIDWNIAFLVFIDNYFKAVHHRGLLAELRTLLTVECFKQDEIGFSLALICTRREWEFSVLPDRIYGIEFLKALIQENLNSLRGDSHDDILGQTMALWTRQQIQKPEETRKRTKKSDSLSKLKLSAREDKQRVQTL
jgi:hypothetical protein